MPTDWGVRGDTTLRALQVQGDQQLRAIALSNAMKQAERDRRARLQEQAMAIGAQQSQMLQMAVLQAARDARLNDQDMARIQQERDWQLYDRSMSETGMAPDEVAQFATSNGMPHQAAYQALVKQKQSRDFQTHLQQAREQAMTLADDELNFEDRRRAKRVKDLQQSYDQLIDSGNLTEDQAKALQGMYLEAQFSALTGWKGRMPGWQPDVVENPATGEIIGERDMDGRIQYYSRGRGTQEQKPLFEPPTPEEIQAEVMETRKATGASVYEDEATGETKPLKDKPVDALERTMAHRSLFYRKYRDAKMTQYLLQEGSWSAAEDRFEKEEGLAFSKYKQRLADEDTERARRSASASTVTGQAPILSRIGPSSEVDDAAAIERLKDHARSGNVRAQQILAGKGVQW